MILTVLGIAVAVGLFTTAIMLAIAYILPDSNSDQRRR